MEQTNFFQNIYSIFSLIFKTPFYFELFIFFLISLFMMILFMIKKDKKAKKLILIIYLILISLLFGYYGKFLIYLFDKIVDLIFSIIYFPNVIVYFILLILININTVLSIFNKYEKIKFLNPKSIMAINITNITCFCFSSLFFFMILEIVIKNNLDFFSQVSLYSDPMFPILVQASSIMFVFNIIIILIILFYQKVLNMGKKNKGKQLNE